MPLSFGLLIDNPAANWLYQSEPEPGTANRAIPGAARQAAGRLQRHQRPGLGARPAARLRHLGADGQARLELAGRGAAVHAHRELRDGDGSNGRGTGGPLRVTEVPDQNPLYDALFKAAVAAGYKLNPDYNSEDQEGVVKTQTSICRGRRMSVAHCYLEPAMQRPNLHVVTEALTRRVLLEGKRCVGIDYEQAGGGRQARGRERSSCPRAQWPRHSSSSCPASASPNC